MFFIFVFCVLSPVKVILAQLNTSSIAAGVVSTFAGTGVMGYSGDGGLATSASFNEPGFLAMDAAGANLYICDFLNHLVS